jgi:hypothetical protein
MLHMAAASKNADAVRMLLARNASVHSVDKVTTQSKNQHSFVLANYLELHGMCRMEAILCI